MILTELEGLADRAAAELCVATPTEGCGLIDSVLGLPAFRRPSGPAGATGSKPVRKS